MKPKDLIFPFIDQEKKVLFLPSERLFFVPHRTERNTIEKWDEFLKALKNSIHLEIGSGNGEWICNQAENHPEQEWFALEMRFDRVRKIWSKMKNRNIKNLTVICAEAKDFLTHYLPSGYLDHIAVNFPDPWPKKRHAKNRLVQPSFLNLVNLSLKPHGSIDLLTDDSDYALQMESVFSEDQRFILDEKAQASFDFEAYGSSYFMKLWQEKNRSFYFFKYEKHVQNSK